MANNGNGTEWDESAPANGAFVSEGPLEIRDIRKGVRIRLEKEHETPDDSSVGGEHIAGSAKGYYQATHPSVRPDASTTLDADDAGRLQVDSDDNRLFVHNGTSGAGGWTPVRNWQPYAKLEERATSGVQGGTATGGAYAARLLTNQVVDADDIVLTLTSATGRFTLAAGTYRVRAGAVAYKVNAHRTRLRDITGGATLLLGTTVLSGADVDVQTESTLAGEFTLSAESSLELQHYFQTTKATNGRGERASSGDQEVYAWVEVWKIEKT
jgi:hypothetical protein